MECLENKDRKDIEDKFKWDLSSLYKSESLWEEDFKETKEITKEIVLYKGKLKDHADNLFAVLKLSDKLGAIIENLYTYAKMKLDENTQDGKYQSFTDKAESLSVEIGAQTSFIVPEIMSLGEKKVKEYICTKDELKLYTQFLNELLRQRAHTLSEKEEEIIAQMGELSNTPENIFSMLNNADIVFPKVKNEEGKEVEITHGNFIPLMESRDRDVRKNAFELLYSTYDSYRNTFAASLNSEVKKNIFHSRVRKYDSALESALDANNISIDVYNNLIDVVGENVHLMHKYIGIRKKLLGLDELHMYDLYTPMISDVDMKIDYEGAKEMMIKGLKPLGQEYIDIVKSGLDSNWIDVYENKGKTSGAYSWGTYNSNPYILLNYHNTLDNVFTLAHEMGHSMHSYYTHKNQPYVYGNYSIFLAEIASTTNEALLMDNLLKNVEEKQERLYLLNHYLEQFRGTIFRQTMFAEFERDIHAEVENGGALTADKLSEMYRDLNKKYYGENIVIDKEIDIEWARIPHFYYNFYVFQYATGFSAAIDFSEKILKQGDSAVERYKKYLKAGSSDYPLEILKNAGIDMTTRKPIESALKLFEELLDEMESLI